jgi:hypothetical protein
MPDIIHRTRIVAEQAYLVQGLNGLPERGAHTTRARVLKPIMLTAVSDDDASHLFDLP